MFNSTVILYLYPAIKFNFIELKKGYSALKQQIG